MTDFVNVADLKYGDCVNCRWTGILNPSGMCPWCEEEFGALAEKWQATRERVQREKASDPWRAQREHAEGEAMIEALKPHLLP